MKHQFPDRYSTLQSPVHRLDARTKIIVSFSAIVLCTSTPPDAIVSLLGYFLFLCAALALSHVPVRYVFARSLVVIPFVLVIAAFVPFVKPETLTGGYSLGVGNIRVSRAGMLLLWNVLVKSYISVLSLVLLSSTTPFARLLEGLGRLKVPKVLITIMGLTYRYIFVLLEEVYRMKRARDSRGFGGKWLWNSKVIGQMIGTLFLRSYERGERIYMAMVSRGFDGTVHDGQLTKLRRDDHLYLGLCLVYLVTARFLWNVNT